jgi:acyl-CoA dehydrogenase
VGITVEGSNTLTRGLIIFGQGLNKSHPHIFPIFQSIQDNNQKMFNDNFNSLVKEIMYNYLSLLNPTNVMQKNSQQQLDHLTLKFSILTNFVALLGGKIKSKQMISGNMADLLSNIYLGYSLIWYHHHHLKKNELRDLCIDYLNSEIEYKMNLIIDNYPITILRPLLIPLKNMIRYPNLENKNKIYSIINSDTNLINILKEDIYYDNTILEKMERLRTFSKEGPEYNKLYQDIISVGEFSIKNAM